MNNKIAPLESMRGLAALTVALFHFETESWLWKNPLVQRAELMVDLFFVLSGFVMALNYIDKIAVWRDALSFQARRFWRLYPLHFFMLLVFLGIEVLKYLVEVKAGMVANVPAFSTNNLEAFVNHVFLTQSLYLSDLSFNKPSWSISAEFFTYMVFAASVVLLRNHFVQMAVAMAVASGLFLWTQDAMSGTTQTAMVRCLYSFSLGILAWRVYMQGFKVGQAWSGFLVFASLVAIVGHVPSTVVPWIFAAMIASVSLSSGTTLYRALSARWLVFLGTISYSVYMVHLAVWWVVAQVLRFGFGIEQVAMSPLLSTTVAILGLAVVVAVSCLTYRMIEHKYRHGFVAYRNAVVT